MRFRSTLLLVLTLIALLPCAEARILGVFQGRIIKASPNKLLFVQGKSGFVRRVDIRHATVEYDDDFPAAARVSKPEEALKVATEVRITAVQKKDVWLADEVLILAPHPAKGGEQSASLVPQAKTKSK
jgi:hypothetical protein